MLNKVICWMVLVCLTGCADFQPHKETNIKNNAVYPDVAFPEVGAFNQSLRVTQLVKARYGDKKLDAQFVVEIDNMHLSLVGLTTNSLSLFTVKVIDSNVEVTHYLATAKNLPVQQMLTDFMLIYLPKTQLQELLAGTQFTLHEDNDKALTRNIYADNHLVISIRYQNPDKWSGWVHYQNKHRGYVLSIETVAIEKASQT